MGWIQYPSKATIREGLKAADPIAASAARTLADQLLTHLERADQPDAVESVVYSSLVRAASEAAPDATKANRFDLLVLAKVHGDVIADLATAMVVFVAREQDREIVNGEALWNRIQAAMRKQFAP